MKTLGILTTAVLLGLGGAAMAGDSGENHQDYSNTTGINPYMPEFSAPAPRSAFAQAPVVHHAVNRHIKK
jgi:hypothetical protein